METPKEPLVSLFELVYLPLLGAQPLLVGLLTLAGRLLFKLLLAPSLLNLFLAVFFDRAPVVDARSRLASTYSESFTPTKIPVLLDGATIIAHVTELGYTVILAKQFDIAFQKA